MELTQRAAWLTERRSMIGSSDIARLYRHRGAALEIWLDKTGRLPGRDSPEMKAGRMLEDVVALWYQEETGRSISPPPRPIVRHPEHPWVGASLDRLSYDLGGQDSRILECKTAGDSRGWGPAGTDQALEEYVVQVQWQMLASGIQQADIAALLRLGDFRVYPQASRPDVQEMLLEMGRRLWWHIEEGVPPELDWSYPETPRLVELLHRPTPGVSIDLHGLEADVYAAEYVAVGEAISDLERRRQTAKAKLLEMMGEASEGRLLDGRVVTRKCVPAKEVRYMRKEYWTFNITKGES